VAAPWAFFSALAHAAKKTVTTTESEASAALAKEKDPMPAAMKYSEAAEKAPSRKDQSAKCDNCMHYSSAVDKSGKPVLVKGSAVGSCALFNAGKTFVKAGGWCSGWFKAPA